MRNNCVHEQCTPYLSTPTKLGIPPKNKNEKAHKKNSLLCRSISMVSVCPCVYFVDNVCLIVYAYMLNMRLTCAAAMSVFKVIVLVLLIFFISGILIRVVVIADGIIGIVRIIIVNEPFILRLFFKSLLHFIEIFL